jgi:DivIVA domain-containing protein
MFSPEELESRSFVFVRRGYDPDEVGAFLRAVAEDVRRLQAEIIEVKALAKAQSEPLDGAMADAVAVVQAARESAARIEVAAEQRATERLRRTETECERRVERARAEADIRLHEAHEQAAAIVTEASAARAAAEAEAVAMRASAEAEASAIKQAVMREVAELDLLSRRRRRILDEAHDNLEQWMTELRTIIREARDAGDGRAAVPAQVDADDAIDADHAVDVAVDAEHAGESVDTVDEVGETSAEEGTAEAYPAEPEMVEIEAPAHDGLGWPGPGRAEAYDVV